MISGVSRHLLPAGLAAVFVASAAHAAQWSLVGGASTSAGADHNPQLRLDDSGTRSSFVFNGSAELARRTETTVLSLAPTLRVARYPAERKLNGEQAGLDAGYALSGERWNLAYSAATARESTRTSELGTTGRTDVDAKRDSSTFGLAAGRLLTERLSVGGSLSHRHTAYFGLGGATGLYGSDNSSGSMNLRYSLSPTVSLTVAGSAAAFDSERAGGSSKSQHLTAGLSYAVAERLALTLSAGPSRVATRHRTDHGIVYTAGFTRRNPLSGFAASASRSVSPSGSGLLTRRDDVGISWSRQLTQRTHVDLGASAIRSREVLSEAGIDLADVRYLRFTAGVRRQLGERWNISLGAARSRQHLRQENRKASGYDASLTIDWSSRNHVF